MALSPERRAELQTLIAEAKAAYHALALGKAPSVVVDQNGERIEFNTANLRQLKAYIQNLEDELSCRYDGRRRPLQVWLK